MLFGCNGIIGFTALSIGNSYKALTSQEIDRLSQESINWFDRSAIYKYSDRVDEVSNILVSLCTTAPVLLLTDKKVRSDWTTFSLMYFETVTFATLVQLIGKRGVERIRPFVYNPDVTLEKKTTKEAQRSFFSGHSTMAFASSVFLSTVYDDYFPNSTWTPYIFYVSLATASVIGYMRYESGRHFPTDILTGAFLGSAIGYLVPILHRAKEDDSIVSLSAGITQFKITLYLRK